MHTNSMKVAISIPDDVFREVEKLVREEGGSRSQVFVTAVRAYVRRLESRRLTAKLDEVYAVPDTPEEKERRRAMAEYQRRRRGRGGL